VRRLLTHTLQVRAPALDYSADVLDVGHDPILLYPVLVDSSLTGLDLTECEDEDSLRSLVRQIPRNHKVVRMVQSLLAQST
jgi:hypothetical protein